MEVRVIIPHGFCSGVENAVAMASRALDEEGWAWCFRDLVHNDAVVAELRAKGMRFVEDIGDVPPGETVLFPAHGVPPDVRDIAEERGLRVIDATCPFVARAHRQVRECVENGVAVVVVGHAAHAEVQGLAGEGRGGRLAVVSSVEEVDGLPFGADEKVGVVCQTTMSAEVTDGVLAALRARCPMLVETKASEACTATRDRQEAVRRFVREVGGGPDVGVLVVGGQTSSNTARLVEVAHAAGAFAWRIGGVDGLGGCDFSGIGVLGVTAGASTPETVVEEVVGALGAQNGGANDESGV